MTFNNSRSIIGIRIRLFTATVLFLLYIVLTYIADVIDFPLLGLSEPVWTVILVAIYLLYAFYPMLLNYQFISYSDEGDKIVFRYFTAGIVGGRKNSVEISKSEFAGYRRDKRLFGLIQSVVLFQQLKEGVAQYPPIYISVLTEKERARLLHSLYSFTPGDAKDVTK